MKKKFMIAGILLFSCFILSGCWNYREISTMDIVTGVAVDKNEQGLYKLTFEMIDAVSASKDDLMQTTLVESEGSTLFEALRNTKKKLFNSLYLGNMQTIIVSRQLAADEGITSIIEGFMRAGEPRENISVIVSQEETAQVILMSKAADSAIVSYELKKIVEEDRKFTATTVNTPMYEIYSTLKRQGTALILPAVHCVDADDEKAPEVNGCALFSEDKLTGFLTPEETRDYLFVTGKIKGGVLPLTLEQSSGSAASLEIRSNRTDRKFSYENGRLVLSIDISTDASAIELMPGIDLTDRASREQISNTAQALITEQVSQMIRTAQNKWNMDIFGFGNMVYKKDPKLWETLRGSWDEVFKSAEIRISTKVNIIDTGIMQKY